METVQEFFFVAFKENA